MRSPDVLAWGQASCAPVLASATLLQLHRWLQRPLLLVFLLGLMTDGGCYRGSQLGLAGGFTYQAVNRLVISCAVGNGIPPFSS